MNQETDGKPEDIIKGFIEAVKSFEEGAILNVTPEGLRAAGFKQDESGNWLKMDIYISNRPDRRLKSEEQDK